MWWSERSRPLDCSMNFGKQNMMDRWMLMREKKSILGSDSREINGKGKKKSLHLVLFDFLLIWACKYYSFHILMNEEAR